MKQGDTIEIIDSLGTYYCRFEEITDDGLDIRGTDYFAIPLMPDAHSYKSGRWAISHIKSIKVISEERRIM